jgi:hypothetical protein
LLQALAAELFDRVTDMLWHDVMMPMLATSCSRKASNTGDNAQEDAMMRWVSCLDVANDRLARALLRVEAFSPLLMPLVQAALIARIDYLFYVNILSVGSATRGPSAFGESGWSVPPRVLPFAVEGRVSFQTGMQLKMAVMHLTHWAHDHDLRDQEGIILYPYTRSTADALMMKKDLLLDDETRNSVASAIPPRALLHLLEHFAPDEFSSATIDAAVLGHMREIAESAPEESAVLQGYVAPTIEELQVASENESAAIRTRRRGRSHSVTQMEVQIGDDSDAEMQELADGATGGARFRLVQQLWGAAHDRRDE